jgi:uncharacterized protein YjbI with pentapeptide repeats
MARGSFHGSRFVNSDVHVYADGCDLSNIRGVSSQIDIRGEGVILDSGLFRSGTVANIELTNSSMFDFEVRDTPGSSSALRQSSDASSSVDSVSISAVNSNCEMFKIERSVAELSMADCDLTDSTFYRCMLVVKFANCNLKNAEFVDVTLSQDSMLSIPSRSTAAFRGLAKASFVDSVLPRRLYELAISAGASMDHVEVIPEDMELF